MRKAIVLSSLLLTALPAVGGAAADGGEEGRSMARHTAPCAASAQVERALGTIWI